ncbi:hypothetical protein [Nocardia sp. NPDC049149]|uniref:hypothetical protein n=1 Tax=Nocardia sp. NPDC049149 TaxID=3364315 RepID=UPI0037132F03
MKRTMRKVAAVAAAAAAAPIVFTATAQADPGTVYFSVGSFNCAIFGDGTTGCDFAYPMRIQYSNAPFTLFASEMVIDQPWLPAHPTFDPGTPYTLPGGNPSLDSVKTGQGQWGPYVEYAGAKCEIGFHGSFNCTSKGRAFGSYGGIVSA